jgi:hypothetical protein
MIDDPELLARQAAYIDTIRGLYRRERNAGFIGCLVGVVVLVWARMATGAPPWALWVGLIVIALGWGCFAYSIFRRTAWVRAHPFDPNGT